MKATTVGLDIAKLVFQVHGADAEGRAVLQRRLRRGSPQLAVDKFVDAGSPRNNKTQQHSTSGGHPIQQKAVGVHKNP